jgi:hypothetical protein
MIDFFTSLSANTLILLNVLWLLIVVLTAAALATKYLNRGVDSSGG